jgi:hypothetical protein
MHKSATKCNETVGKWCKNKHGASKIIDTLETYHWSISTTRFHVVWKGRSPSGGLPLPPCPQVDLSKRETTFHLFNGRHKSDRRLHPSCCRCTSRILYPSQHRHCLFLSCESAAKSLTSPRSNLVGDWAVLDIHWHIPTFSVCLIIC